MDRELLHATAVAVAIDPDGPLLGALLLGSSGHGKSTIALELVEICPFRRSGLVSDDVTLVVARGGALFAEAPKGATGLIEIRGFGPARARAAPAVALFAGFDLAAASERLPDPAVRATAGGALKVWPFTAGPAAAARIRVILREILAKGSVPPRGGEGPGSSRPS